MEFRDPIHGSIEIYDEEIPIIEHPFFQRLRNIKQLGFSEYIFPGATHTRFLHSLGVMHLSSLIFDKLFEKHKKSPEYRRLKETLRLACLLHDIGHAPLSHATESVMPDLHKLNINEKAITSQSQRKANHEDYTIKAIIDSSFSKSFKEVCNTFGVAPKYIAQLIRGQSTEDEYFTIQGINYFTLLHQLVSSEMDCDRMDYLLRDSYFCGVSYGQYDLSWIINNLTLAVKDNHAYLAITERAISTFDDFLLSRFHMFLMVYFHYRAVCLEKILLRYFKSTDNQYSIPHDIEEYVKHDDYYLMNTIRASHNKWAKMIVSNTIPTKIFETFGNHYKSLERLKNLELYLKSEDIDYIKCSSTGRLSKYYNEEVKENPHHIMVAAALGPFSREQPYRTIKEATELYERYSKSHAVNRIHCFVDTLSSTQKDMIIEIINQ